SVGGLATRVVSAGEVGRRGGGRRDAMFGVEWVEGACAVLSPPHASVVLATWAVGVCDELRSAGVECELFADMEELAEAADRDGAEHDGAPRVLLLDARALP